MESSSVDAVNNDEVLVCFSVEELSRRINKHVDKFDRTDYETAINVLVSRNQSLQRDVVRVLWTKRKTERDISRDWFFAASKARLDLPTKSNQSYKLHMF